MKAINKLFGRVFKFIDKHLVIPITKLILKISGHFDHSSKWFENILSKQSTLLFLSLFFAIIIFIVVDQKIISFTTSSAEVFREQPVEVLYAEERFVVEGLPESVDITLIGSKADLYIAKQSSIHKVTADLTNIKEPGTYKVDLEYEVGTSSIQYSVNPSQVTVVVYAKQSENRTLSYNIVNADHLDDTLDISNVELNIDQVTISGAKYKLDQVANVEALVDIDKLPKQEEGTQTLDDIILKAYDKEGNIVDVEFSTTSKPSAEVTIASSSKEINLNFVPINEMPFGRAIGSYAFSNNKVRVYGSTEILNELEKTGIDIEIDVSKLTEDYHTTVEIPKPKGIKKLDINNVDLDIVVTSSAEPKVMTLKIDALNTPSGYTAGAVSADDVQVLVEVKGASNILDNLTNADVQAYVDLSSYGEGTFDIPIEIKPNTSSARLVSYVPKKATVKIKITKNN